MDMRELGNTGIRASAFGLGVMTFGAQTDAREAFAQLDLATEAGINLFDAAENYPAPVLPETQGRTEQILGDWITARGVRDKVIVATKVTGPGGMEHIRGDKRRLDRANIMAAIDGSLRRLKTDYIDLYQLHWPDRPISTAGRARFLDIPDSPEIVPIEETLDVMKDLVASGKIRHVGVSNETPWGVMRYLVHAAQTGAPRIVTIQNGYNLLDRRFEIGLAEIAIREKVGLIAYSPLASGLLSGKYAKGMHNVHGTRIELFPGMDKRYDNPAIHTAVAAYIDIARRHGLDTAAMALAFIRQQPFVTSVLVAASSVEQLKRNLLSTDLALSREIVKEIDAVHDAAPNPSVRR